MTPDDDLDRELRRLFGDDRLDVSPRAGVESDILAGARRIRRRRAALATTGGALTALVLVGGGLLLTDLRSGPDQAAAPATQPELSLSSSPSTIVPAPPASPPPATSSDSATPGTSDSLASSTPGPSTRPSTPSTTSTPRVESVPQATGPVLGPSGYGKLQLGMSFENAKATGLLTGTDTAPEGCADYRLTEGAAALSDVRISSTYGIVSFEATGARTPEKIKIGSTEDQLETAYPDASSSGSGYSAASGAGGAYLFGVDSGKVVSLRLVGAGSC